MIPLYDESSPQLRKPIVVITLIGINAIIYLISFFVGDSNSIARAYGFIPQYAGDPGEWYRYITALFIHGGFGHLLGNMWSLWLFGDNLEDILGHWRFLLYYLIGGIVASVFHSIFLFDALMKIPVVGASGAVSAVMGGYILLFPHNRIKSFIMIAFRPVTYFVRAWIYIGAWFILQLLASGKVSSISYVAHVGGFVLGLNLMLILKRYIKRVDFIGGEEIRYT